MVGAKPLRIRFNKIDGFIYDGTRYLVLFWGKKYDFIYNRIKYLIKVKSVIMYVISHNHAKIKVDSNYSLPLEKTSTFHDIIIHTKSVWDKSKWLLL